MKAPHFPFSCKFNDNETLASYANGIYDYYDVEQIEEFVAFMGGYEIESLFKECENLDDAVYRPASFAIPKYFYILGNSFYSLSHIFVIEIIEDKINKIK